jgi:F-type H+-transporting ATPase subunit b
MQYLSFHAHFWQYGTFWVTVAVVLFLAVFGRKLLGGIFGAVDNRSASIQRELDEAQRLRHDAEAMLLDAQRRQAEAVRFAHDMLENARKRAERIAQDLAKDAAETQARREAMVTDRINAAKLNAIKEVRAAAASLAVEAATRVLHDSFDADRDASAIDHAIEGLPAALGSRRAA